MHDAPGNEEPLVGSELCAFSFCLDGESAREDEKKLVLFVVLVPVKLAALEDA